MHQIRQPVMKTDEELSSTAAASLPPAGQPLTVRNERSVSRYLMTLAAFVIVVAGMKAAAPLVAPFCLAVFIAVVSAPMFLWMQRAGLPSGIALLIMIGLLIAFSGIVAALINLTITNYADLLAQYQPALRARTAELFAWLGSHGIATPESVRGYFNFQWVIRNFGAIAGTVGDLIATSFIVLVFTIFMLLEAAALPIKMHRLVGVDDGAWDVIRQIGRDVRQYMVLKTVMSILTGVLIGLMLLAIGVDFAITLGLLAFIFNYVPVVGAVVASIPGILLALIEFGFGTSILTGLGYLVINLSIHNAVEPRYMGHGLGLSPLVVLSSVIFWGWVLGPIGMLLSVPLTMTLKIALESDDATRWLGLLMGAKPHGETAAAAE